MNWRRGFLLAGINLLAAAPLIWMLAMRDTQFLREQDPLVASLTKHKAIARAVSDRERPARIVRTQEEQTVSFSSCGMWGHDPAQVNVVQLGNLPAFLLSQWRVDCPAKWSLAGILGVKIAGRWTEANLVAMRRVDLALCLSMILQWLLVGGFPLVKPRKWWGEPAAFITAFTLAGACISMIPAIDGMARLTALIAFFGWMGWFGLLVWVPVHFAWQSTLGGLRRLSN